MKNYEQEAEALNEQISSEINNRLENEPTDEIKSFKELILIMRHALGEGKKPMLGFGKGRVVDVDTCIAILDDMEKNLPAAVQRGANMYGERERLMKKAEDDSRKYVVQAGMRANKMMDEAQQYADRTREDADTMAKRIIEEAEEKARELVSDSEIRRRAEREADDIIGSAQEYADKYVSSRLQDAISALGSVGDSVSDFLATIDKSRNDLAYADTEAVKNGEAE